MKQQLRLLFYIKRHQPLRNGAFSIICRISIGGRHCTFSTRLTCSASNWDQRRQRLSGRTSYATHTNHLLDEIRFSLYETYLRLLRSPEPISPHSVRQHFLGRGYDSEGVIAYFRRHNDEFNQMVGTTRSRSTLYKYRYVCDHLQRYLHAKHKVEDLPIQRVDAAFIHGFHRWLMEVEQCCVNTIKVYMIAFKHIMTTAINNGLMIKNPFIGYKLSGEPSHRNFLQKEELRRLTKYTPTSRAMTTILDAFLFSCFTGLSYTDLMRLRMADVVAVGNNLYISTHRVKTRTAVNVPLLHCALHLLQKYDRGDEGALFALPSNCRCNAVLRQIMSRVGIDKRITFHSARHTFATTITLANGVSIESVSSMLGHTDIKTTQIYAKVLRSTMTTEMQRAEKSIDSYYKMRI